jgi:hypothetical protein
MVVIGRSGLILALIAALCGTASASGLGGVLGTSVTSCPSRWPDREWGTASGPLVPSQGAVSVTMCELGVVFPHQAKAPDRARTISGDVRRMVEVLNGLSPLPGGPAERDGRTRRLDDEVIATFMELYREQQAGQKKTTPACAERLPVEQVSEWGPGPRWPRR